MPFTSALISLCLAVMMAFTTKAFAQKSNAPIPDFYERIEANQNAYGQISKAVNDATVRIKASASLAEAKLACDNLKVVLDRMQLNKTSPPATGALRLARYRLAGHAWGALHETVYPFFDPSEDRSDMCANSEKFVKSRYGSVMGSSSGNLPESGWAIKLLSALCQKVSNNQ